MSVPDVVKVPVNTPPLETTSCEVEAMLVTAKFVEVALVLVELPVMVKSPLIVEEAVEMKPPSVDRPETAKVFLTVELAFDTNPLPKYHDRLSVAVVEAL